MDTNEKNKQIDVKKVLNSIWVYRMLFIKVLSVVFVVSCIYILPIPRTYTCKVALAPELTGADTQGSLSSLASSFGINIGGAMTQDAIYPTLYPDLMASTDFILSLFPVKVTTSDNKLTTNYCDYIRFHLKKNIWTMPITWMRNIISSLTEDNKNIPFKGTDKLNAFNLTREQQKVIEKISDNISCELDKKTNVISITVTDQDPLICASIADTVSARLQEFITNYRTNKSRVDLKYYQKLTDEAKKEYYNSMKVYAQYSDSHMDLTLESYKTKLADLENDMQIKFNTYSTMNTQLQAAKAKVQERTPAFTTLQCATVPVKPTGPKRMLFVLGMLCLSFFVTSMYVLNKIVKK